MRLERPLQPVAECKLAKMVTGTKFRDGAYYSLLQLGSRKFEPATTFAEPAI
jgi:hypothetical protein